MESILEPRKEAPVGTPRIDNLAIIYVVLNVFWTTVVLAASIALWQLRRYECLRKRNVALSIAAVLLLQVYWAVNMVIYPLNGTYPCDLNYWVMSIYFPLGIALFQLQNVQLLSVSARQRELRRQPFKQSDRLTIQHLQFWRYHQSWKQMTLLSKIYFGISVCVVTQVVLSLTVFLVSRKFVSFGVTGSHPKVNAECVRGWEWVMTILCQGIWTYVFGPWLLWRIRKIDDIFHWKLQTVLAIVFSLPGLPMWLISTRLPAWAPVTANYPDACWYNPGICVMQGVALFFPLYEALCAKRRQIRTWPGSEKTLQPSTDVDIESQIKGSKHSLRAFEEALQNSSRELLEYASTREFTGENILFLNCVRDFKASWTSALAKDETPSIEYRQKFFSIATDIFDRFVSLQTSQFPINIDSHIYHELKGMFGRDVVPYSSVVAPFADRWSLATIAAITKTSDKYTANNDPVRPGSSPTFGDIGGTSSEFILSTRANAIPEAFEMNIFDEAERSVKYMVFTNTWVRYAANQTPCLASYQENSTCNPVR